MTVDSGAEVHSHALKEPRFEKPDWAAELWDSHSAHSPGHVAIFGHTDRTVGLIADRLVADARLVVHTRAGLRKNGYCSKAVPDRGAAGPGLDMGAALATDTPVHNPTGCREYANRAGSLSVDWVVVCLAQHMTGNVREVSVSVTYRTHGPCPSIAPS